MKKVYISPIVEKIDIPYEESILAGSPIQTGQEFGNGDKGYKGGITDEDDDIITLSKGNSLFFESED